MLSPKTSKVSTGLVLPLTVSEADAAIDKMFAGEGFDTFADEDVGMELLGGAF